MKTFIFFSIFNSSLIFISSHPISFGITLLVQTIIISVSSRILSQSSWMPLTFFLVMVGGLMILFLYITSICSNKKSNFMKSKMMQFFYTFSLMIFLENFSTVFTSKDCSNMKDLFNMEFLNLFLPMNIFSSNFMFLYLLVMLIIMIEILSLNKGPMRKKY